MLWLTLWIRYLKRHMRPRRNGIVLSEHRAAFCRTSKTKLVTTSGVIQLFFSIQLVPVHEVAIWSKQRVGCIVPLDDLVLTDVLRTDQSVHEPCLLQIVGQNDTGLSSGWIPSLWILSRTDSARAGHTRQSNHHHSPLRLSSISSWFWMSPDSEDRRQMAIKRQGLEMPWTK